MVASLFQESGCCILKAEARLTNGMRPDVGSQLVELARLAQDLVDVLGLIDHRLFGLFLDGTLFGCALILNLLLLLHLSAYTDKIAHHKESEAITVGLGRYNGGETAQVDDDLLC